MKHKHKFVKQDDGRYLCVCGSWIRPRKKGES